MTTQAVQAPAPGYAPEALTGEPNTMQAIVQDEYGTDPEQVLRLAEIAKPALEIG